MHLILWICITGLQENYIYQFNEKLVSSRKRMVIKNSIEFVQCYLQAKVCSL